MKSTTKVWVWVLGLLMAISIFNAVILLVHEGYSTSVNQHAIWAVLMGSLIRMEFLEDDFERHFHTPTKVQKYGTVD